MDANRSAASIQADKGLEIFDHVLSFAKRGVGNPGHKERALFLSATAMAYAVWENYVEQVAIETASFLAGKVAPEKVPDSIRTELVRKDAWQLTVHPGWRALWIDMVTVGAVGSEDSTQYGMNTAGRSQVGKLFNLVGIEAFKDVADAEQLDKLILDRGTIVHKAQAPGVNFKKADATGWRDYVKALYESFDQSVRTQASALGGSPPW
ncbi:MAG: hypothetical protein HYX34_11700 [Actinobacteria bacterium]|nr:hypothetical protein [Actinomycetota bacterium]